jgi:hypothetical protein
MRRLTLTACLFLALSLQVLADEGVMFPNYIPPPPPPVQPFTVTIISWLLPLLP